MRHILKTGLSLCLGLLLTTPSISAAETTDQFRQDYLAGNLKWQDVLDRAAAEGKVSFLYWGGNDVLNVWVDSVVGPAMANLGITLSANRLTGTQDAVTLVLSESDQAETNGQGNADIIWLNGENFLTLAERDVLFGAFARHLPNSKNYDWNADDPRSNDNLWDFGTEIKAREIAWSSEQYVCAVNRQYVQSDKTPKSFSDLQIYLEKSPGTFTYVSPPDNIGNTFVQAVLYAFNPDRTGAQPFQKSIGATPAGELTRLIQPGMDFLRTLEPNLLKDKSGAPNYPVDTKAADVLFRDGKIHFTCEFGTYAAATKVAIGHYPNTAEAMIFPEGLMIKNKNYLAIPSNAAHPAAALVLANFMSSVEAQASKLGFVGYPTGIDHWMLDREDIKKVEKVAPPHIGVKQSELDANAVPDMNASLVEIINLVWRDYIGNNSKRSIHDLVSDAYSSVGK